MKKLLKKQSTTTPSFLAFQAYALSPQASQCLKGGEEDIIIHDVVDG